MRIQGAGSNDIGLNECLIVTWNIQIMSIRDNIRAQLGRVSNKVVGEG